MSQPQDGRRMDQSVRPGGSVKRARERAEAGEPRDATSRIPDRGKQVARKPETNPNTSPSKPSRPQAPPGLQGKDGQIGVSISRPTPAPQWPLGGSLASAASSDSTPYRPPPDKAKPPQRPPRPSHVPSMLDASKVQDHTPVFQYSPQNPRVSELSIPETPLTQSSRPSTQSSVGSIPDFPMPVLPPPAQPRRSVNLGPPPSSRRGASSFYSTASYVSPIPEESPRSKSGRASYASSAAIPESFGTLSPGQSPNDAYFDDTIAEESVYSDDTDERGLVRSASIGKRGKPALVTTKSSDKPEPLQRPQWPMQVGAFSNGTAYFDGSSNSSGTNSNSRGSMSTATPPVGTALTADTMLNAFEAAGTTDLAAARKMAPAKSYRLSGLRRPPRLDIDAVREAESRGSLTSLPDLIRRATRLAAMMDKGRRPASRVDALDFPIEYMGADAEKNAAYDLEKHQSGLSDMLAAFPPPGQAGSRQSVRQSGTSWPLPLGRKSFRPPFPQTPVRSDEEVPKKKARRCCGLPLWGFILVIIVLLVLIAAAIVLPLEFFVLRKPSTTTASPQPDLSTCQSQLPCLNGGTSLISQGVCACICTNGFTGSNCGIAGSQGCTTTSIVTDNSTNVNNVTLGQAIPRLVQQAQTNFSIPLSGSEILAKFNSANVSCVIENALVTFDGESIRIKDAQAGVSGLASQPTVVRDAAASLTLTLSGVTLTIGGVSGTVTPSIITTITNPTTLSGSFSTLFVTTITPSETSVASQETTTLTTTTTKKTQPTGTATSASASATATGKFTVTEEVLDFARVAVLFVLQEETLSDATTAQNQFQTFFTSAQSNTGVTATQARNLTIGGGNTVNLVNFAINLNPAKTS